MNFLWRFWFLSGCCWCLATASALPPTTPNTTSTVPTDETTTPDTTERFLIISDEPNAAYDLEKLNVFKENITLSGFSSGASMAIQTHMSHSSLFSGLAIFSQAFYMCGHRSLIEFGLRCSTHSFGLFPYSASSSVDDAIQYANKDLIDPLVNLRRQRYFIWAGELDAYIPPDMVAANVEFYEALGVNSSNMQYTLFHNASHLIPTDHYGPPCEEDADQYLYLGNCNYSGPYYALNYLFNRTLVYGAQQELSQLKTYNQSVFYPDGDIGNPDVAMGTRGFIYTPKRCANQTCSLHLNFHGCNEWAPEVAQQYIINSGWLSVAEGNGIILIFPLTTRVASNMGGCWDFYSYTGTNFATKNGAQIKVVRRILDRVLNGV